MLIEEFEKRTGFFPSTGMYAIIEKRYTDFHGDKDAFCAAYKKNVDGLAESIQLEANIEICKQNQRWRNEVECANKKAVMLRRQVERLQEELDRERGWKPYEVSQMTQDKYNELRNSSGTRMLTEDEARKFISDEFGFMPDRVAVKEEIPTYEIDRHRQIRKKGAVARHPVYNATDWYYIRFDVWCGGITWQYEAIDGQLFQYAD